MSEVKREVVGLSEHEALLWCKQSHADIRFRNDSVTVSVPCNLPNEWPRACYTGKTLLAVVYAILNGGAT